MSNALKFGEAIIVIKELFNSTSDFFENLVPNNFYKVMDKLAFLNAKFIAIGSNGNMLDGTKKIAEAIINLSNFVVWGVLLFYAFKSLFGYFLSKKVDVPWKFFIRMIVFGILANASFFICYSGIFFAENCTEYIREFNGKEKISFECLEDYIVEEKLDAENDKLDIYTFDALMSIFIYFSTFLMSICLAGRYIVVKVLILLSPIFFIFGGFKSSEKLFFLWCKKFGFLMFLQIFLSVILGVVNSCDSDAKILSQMLVCGMLLIVIKNVCGFLKLSN